MGLRGGPCGDVTGAEASGNTSEDDNKVLSTSLEAKYFSQSYQEPEDSDDSWNLCPDKLEFQQGLSKNKLIGLVCVIFYQRVFLQVLQITLCTRMKMGSGSLIWLIIPPLRKRSIQTRQRT